MITYCLYVKTHKKTGLQYLGFTTKDPFNYNGSGLHWCRHLKKHGSDHTTEIIQKCHTKSGIKSWGLYYSNLWCIVESKKWANIKPESGTGGQLFTGDNNPMRNPEVVKKFTGDNSASKRPKVREKISIAHKSKGDAHHNKDPKVIAKRSGKNHYTKATGYTSKDNPFYDHTVYCWVNKTTGEQVRMTQHDFQQKYKAGSASTSSLIAGRIKSTVGWIIQK